MTPWVLRLLVANIGVFFLQVVAPRVADPLVFFASPLSFVYRPWTLVTYMFLHGGLWHLFFNMLALFFFGPRLEERLGGRHFLGLYFLSGIMGALLSIPFSPGVAIVGASGAIFGVLLGFARYWPRAQILIWGVLPVEARWMVVGLTVLSLFMGIRGGGGVAHFAHLGGFAGGWLYIKWFEHRSPAKQFRRQAASGFSTAIENAAATLTRWSTIRREDLHEVNRDELDRILDKISAQGIGSLSKSDREFLDRFSSRT